MDDALEWLDQPEANQHDKMILMKWGMGPVIPLEHVLVTDAFLANCRKNPNHIALECGSDKITYSELYQKSKNLSFLLLTNGLKTGDFVPILSSRSIYMVVSVLAILFAGGAFVVIDKSYPLERISVLLKEISPKILLCTPCISPEIQIELKLYGKMIILSEKILKEYYEAKFPSRDVDPQDPCCCIFTSGSTGVPKGVLIKHISLANYSSVQTRNLYEPKYKWANVLSTSFIVTVSDIFCCLSSGSTLLLRGNDIMESIALCDAVHLTPSMLSKLDPEECKHLKIIRIGGETPSLPHVKKFSKHSKVFNNYGPTEVTVDSSISQILEKVTSGKPLPNTIQYIVNPKTLALVPPGSVGELLVGGLGVAIGYLSRPNLTNEKFIMDPFKKDGSKVFRTGDLCKWNNDGEIQYIGREDGMVKINGYRVELNEVKVNLEHVQNAEVLKIDGKLVAFVNPRSVDIRLIKRAAREKLPAYMVPSIIIPLQEMPLNNNSKVDKLKLRQYLRSHHHAICDNGISSNLVGNEKIVADIMKRVLKVGYIDSQSDFFEEGGDSISAMSFCHILRGKGLYLTVNDIFNFRTVQNISNASIRKTETKYDDIWFVR